jgi:hypothetical protein
MRPSHPALAAVSLCALALTLPGVLGIDLAANCIATDAQALAVLGSTVAFSALLAFLALRSKSLGRAMLWLLLGPVCGFLNTVASLALVLSIDQGAPFRAIDGALVLGSFAGVTYGAPMGVALALVYAVPIGAAVRARTRPSHDGVDRAMIAAGASSALAGALGLLVGVPAGAAAHSPLVLAGPPACALVLGLVGLGYGAARRVMRARWAFAVAHDRVSGWRLVPRVVGADDAVLPLFRGDAWACDGVLVRAELKAEPAAPYRSAVVHRPYALVRSASLAPFLGEALGRGERPVPWWCRLRS